MPGNEVLDDLLGVSFLEIVPHVGFQYPDDVGQGCVRSEEQLRGVHLHHVRGQGVRVDVLQLVDVVLLFEEGSDGGEVGVHVGLRVVVSVVGCVKIMILV